MAEAEYVGFKHCGMDTGCDIHERHLVLIWMTGNVVVDTDPAGNIKVTKAKSKEKIDGIVAAIMALDRCIGNQTEPQGSVYDERGLLVL